VLQANSDVVNNKDTSTCNLVSTSELGQFFCLFHDGTPTHQLSAGDLRPISVTSILSRTVIKLVVRNYLTPLLRSSSFCDQYAYKPTGSTTCALADLTYRIHTLLESNQYVRCVLIDFSKAFDTVDHVILARKLFCLETPFFIIQWIMSFLTDHNQATKLGFHLSPTLPINRSINTRFWYRTNPLYNVCP